jgi:hypothetical protein
MLSVEDWAEIRRLHRAEGLPIKVIARVLGVSGSNYVRFASPRRSRLTTMAAENTNGRSRTNPKDNAEKSLKVKIDNEFGSARGTRENRGSIHKDRLVRSALSAAAISDRMSQS